MRVVSALLAIMAAGTAAAFSTAPYFPLADNNSWTYYKDGASAQTRTVQPGTQTINGVATKIFYFSPENEYNYYTNDANGIRGHRGAFPPYSVQNCGVTPETDTFSPPFRIAPADATPGQVITDSGNMSMVLNCGTFSFTYSTQSQMGSAPETLSVPLGTFIVQKLTFSRTIYTADTHSPINTFSSIYWVAENVGVVKSSEVVNGFPHTYVLSGTNVMRTAPDPFSFTVQTGLAPGATATSGAITVTGTTTGSPISISGGLYSINGGTYTSASGTVSNGQSVTLQQTASALSLTTTNAVLTIGGVSATFAVTTANTPAYALTVNTTGTGTITSNPSGINCGATCTANFAQGTGVTLTPTPGANYQFTGWSGACTGAGGCTVTMNAPATVTATFALVPDTQAPTVPAGLTATAVSGTQINLAWNASSDNRGVTVYQIFRNAVQVATVSALATKYSDTSLAATTLYSYTVAACDAAANCSAQSTPSAATTLAAGQFAFSLPLEPGFNLGSNALNVTLDVAALFGNQDAPVGGITANIVSVWKWNAVDQRWAFYSPQLTGAANASYAASHNFEILSVVNPGEGYWVNAINAMTLPAQSGTGFAWNGFNFSGLSSGFNLIAQANAVTPSQFNILVSPTPPSPGVIPIDNFVSLWAWDASAGKWYFYSPLLEASGALAAVKAYADSHNYLHFQDYAKQIGIGSGFWVNRP